MCEADVNTDPYASHLPLLSSLGCIGSGIKRILELGPGIYSTPLFLNREFYPHVEKVLSIEHNPDWANKIRTLYPDERLSLVVMSEPIEDYLTTLKINEFDLIFVDNSDTCAHRVKTIEYLGEVCISPLVVIHDFQAGFYQEAARNFPNKIVDTRSGPHTGLVWKGGPINYLGEQCLNKTLA